MTPDDIPGAGAAPASMDLHSADGATRAAPDGLLPLRVALADYDRTRPLIDGRVRAEGLRLDITTGDIREFCVRPVYEEFDVAEMSLSWYVAARDRGEPVIALPIFPLRMAVLGYVFCRAESPFVHPGELAGRRIASPGYRYTVNLWLRGILKDHYGLAPEEVSWVTGEREGAGYVVPPGIDVTVVPGRSPAELLFAGEVDAVIGPEAPDAFRDGDPRIRRLFPDARAESADYFRRTGIFPITHTVVIGESLLRRAPWVTRPLFDAFAEAQRACESFYYANAKHVSLPGAVFVLEEERRAYGPAPWRQGLAANRHVIETFVRYAHEQGYIRRRPAVEELFAENTLDL